MRRLFFLWLNCDNFDIFRQREFWTFNHFFCLFLCSWNFFFLYFRHIWGLGNSLLFKLPFYVLKNLLFGLVWLCYFWRQSRCWSSLWIRLHKGTIFLCASETFGFVLRLDFFRQSRSWLLLNL